MTATPTVEQLTTAVGELTQMLSTVLIDAQSKTDPRRIYSLEEVAAVTGWALDTLRQDCRNKRIPFVRKGNAFGLTGKMLDAEIARRSEIPATHLVAPPQSADRPKPGNRSNSGRRDRAAA